MKRMLLVSTLAAMAAASLATGTMASDHKDKVRADLAPREQWMSIADLTAKLESRGYKIREIDTDDGYYEVEMLDAKGYRVEADLHPVTGEPLPARSGSN